VVFLFGLSPDATSNRLFSVREFPRQVPDGTQFFERVLGIPNNPDAFAAAGQCPVFRIDPQTHEL
jgi:hypothetical protein